MRILLSQIKPENQHFKKATNLNELSTGTPFQDYFLAIQINKFGLYLSSVCYRQTGM